MLGSASLHIIANYYQPLNEALSLKGKTVRLDKIDDDLKDISFKFFYWFSRFEFALKENDYLKDNTVGAKAEPNWEKFKNMFKDEYTASAEAIRLIDLHPKRQFVAQAGEPEWKPVGIEHCNNELCKVVTMLLTIRNNLFHGGKHGDIDVDSKGRNIELLTIGIEILNQLANLSGIEGAKHNI